jgi:hypothetical protein
MILCFLVKKVCGLLNLNMKNKAALLTASSLVGGISSFVEMINGFAPYSFMQKILRVMGADGNIDETRFFTKGIFNASPEELARVYLIGFKTQLIKSNLPEFKSTSKGAVPFFDGLTTHIWNDSTSVSNLDKFLVNNVFECSTLHPHHEDMEKWAMLPAPLREHLKRVSYVLKKTWRTLVKCSGFNRKLLNENHELPEDCGYCVLTIGDKKYPAFKTSNDAIITIKGLLKGVNGEQLKVASNPMRNMETIEAAVVASSANTNASRSIDI